MHALSAGTDARDGGPGPRRFSWPRFLRNAVVLLVLVACAAAGWAYWDEHVRDRVFVKNFGIVEPERIYRAGKLTPETLERLVRERGVRTVIDFGAYANGSPGQARMAETAGELGIVRLERRLAGDGRGDPNHYVDALRRMAAATPEEPIVVHCHAGAQRTGMCVLLYRTIVQGRPLDAAYEETFGYGHDPGDNWRFLTYLARWHDDIERAYHEGTTIEFAPPPGAPAP